MHVCSTTKHAASIFHIGQSAGGISMSIMTGTMLHITTCQAEAAETTPICWADAMPLVTS